MAITAIPKRSVAATSTPSNRRNWGIVVMLLIFFMLNFADKAAIGLASKPIRESMDLSASQYGLLSSAFFWLFAVGAVVLTAAFRKISYNWAAGILMITWILTMLPLTTQTTFGVLLASRIGVGLLRRPCPCAVPIDRPRTFPSGEARGRRRRGQCRFLAWPLVRPHRC